jgi:hypothetical protein
MLSYLKINVNPHHRKTGDCSTRALCCLLHCSWESALQLQCSEAIRTGYDPTSHQVIEAILMKAGWVKMRQPRKEDGTKFKVREMDVVCSPEDLEAGVIADVAHHYVFLKGPSYWDEWDSGWKTVGNWFRCERATHCDDGLPRLFERKERAKL